MNKLKRWLIILLSIVFVMLVIPLIIIHAADANSGMIMCLLLFFGINPALAIFVGIFSGKDLKYFWVSPFVIAILFWLFSCFTFATAFPIVYSSIYFAICAMSEIITYFITKKQR